MSDDWTPERPDSHWKTAEPWTFLAQKGKSCQYHGEFVSRLVKAVLPSGYEQKMARLPERQREAMAPFMLDWWTRCPRCDDTVHTEQMEVYEEAMHGIELRKALRKQKAALAGIPVRYADAHIYDNYKLPLPSAGPKVAQVRNWVGAIDINLDSGRSLCITGKVGTGKTHIACAVANFCLGKGLDVRFSTEEDMYSAVKSTFGKESGGSAQDVSRAFTQCDLLIIDEVGRYTQTEFDAKVIGNVINTRYERCRPTILTSNRSPADLGRLLGAAVWSRLSGNMQTVAFTWQDLRSEYDGKEEKDHG